MTVDEIGKIRHAIGTIRNHKSYLEYLNSVQNPNILLNEEQMEEKAQECVAELSEVRVIIEAHSLTGQPFPPTAWELASLLIGIQDGWFTPRLGRFDYLVKPAKAPLRDSRESRA